MELARQRDEGALRGQVPAEEDHPTDLAAGDPGQQGRTRRRAVHRDDQALADQPLEGPDRRGRGCGGAGEENDREGDEGRPERPGHPGPAARPDRAGHWSPSGDRHVSASRPSSGCSPAGRDRCRAERSSRSA